MAEEFGWESWLLVVAVAVAFLGIPGAILLAPPDAGAGVYLAAPLATSLGLGALAVWAAVRAER